MTAMKDAFAKAAKIDPKLLDLKAAAVQALEATKHNLRRATTRFAATLAQRRELREAIAADFLQRVAAEKGIDTKDTAATATPKVKEQPADGSVKVTAYKVPSYRRRTHEEREAALQSAGRAAASMASAYDRQIDGRSIGELRWGELQAMRHQNAFNAASFLRFGTEATANFILLDKIEAYCRVDDHSMKIRDVISAAQLQALAEEADVEAPRMIGAGMEAWVNWLETQRGQRGAIAQ
jgi:hypothetical protein